jgi:hypothetical protein
LEGGSRPLDTMWHLSTLFATINPSHKYTCNEMWKKNELANEIVGFSGLIVFP